MPIYASHSSPDRSIRYIGRPHALRRLRNRLEEVEDYALKSYELETLRLIRAANWRLRFYSTDTLYRLYNRWSTATYCASWMHPSSGAISAFVKWAL